MSSHHHLPPNLHSLASIFLPSMISSMLLLGADEGSVVSSPRPKCWLLGFVVVGWRSLVVVDESQPPLCVRDPSTKQTKLVCYCFRIPASLRSVFELTLRLLLGECTLLLSQQALQPEALHDESCQSLVVLQWAKQRRCLQQTFFYAWTQEEGWVWGIG